MLCQQLYEASLRGCALLLPPCLLRRHRVTKALEEQLLALGVADGLWRAHVQGTVSASGWAHRQCTAGSRNGGWQT